MLSHAPHFLNVRFVHRHAPSRLEQDSRAEAQDAIRNLVLMLASLTMCGHTELKPSQASMGSLFQMLGFALPQPSNRGINIPTNKCKANVFFTKRFITTFKIFVFFQEEVFEISKHSKSCNLCS